MQDLISLEKKLSDLDDLEIAALAKSHPRFLATHRPHLVAIFNDTWMCDYYADWMARHYPLVMVKSKPYWMAYKYPDILASLDFQALCDYAPAYAIAHHTEQVVDTSRDILQRYDVVYHGQLTGLVGTSKFQRLKERIMLKLGLSNKPAPISNPVLPGEYRNTRMMGEYQLD